MTFISTLRRGWIRDPKHRQDFRDTFMKFALVQVGSLAQDAGGAIERPARHDNYQPAQGLPASPAITASAVVAQKKTSRSSTGEK
jgi:hypothetical protein